MYLIRKFMVLSFLMISVGFACEYLYVGNDVEFDSSSSHSPNYLLGSMFTLETDATIEYLNVIGKSAGPSAILALYSDDGTRSAADLVVQTEIFTLEVGYNNIPVPSTFLPAGDYWIMGNYSDQASIGIDNYNNTEVQYISLPFGDELPAEISNPNAYDCIEFT